MRSTSPTDYLAGDADRGGMPAYDASEALSLIDRYSYFEGTYRSQRDLRIEGEVKGTIECQGTLHIAEGAQVDAHVQAESITVAGELSGEIICRGRLQIMTSGRLHGKVTTQTLVINEGAVYEGQLEMIAPETSKRIGPATSTPRPIASIANTPTGAQPEPGPSASLEAAEAAPARPTAVDQVPSEQRSAPTPAPNSPSSGAHPRQNNGFTPAGKNASTFIRRLGGTEVPLGSDDDTDEDK
jgi:cytoskeletal protein CcmA (bactofilin family)